MKLSILDLGVTNKNSNSISYIHELIDYTNKSDELGFYRFWLGEHHENDIAWRSPAILLSILAGFTNNIKLGTAGVLLNLNNPLRIAQDYKLLENLFPGRVDLGIAKGLTEDIIINELLEGQPVSNLINNFYPRFDKLINFISDQSKIITPPMGGSIPEIWMLGTSETSIPYVCDKQLSFSLSLFHGKLQNYIPTPDIIKKLNEQYFQRHNMKPKYNIAITVLCSNDKTELEEMKKNYFEDKLMLNVSGNENEVKDYISDLSEKYQTNEIVVLDVSHNYNSKINTLNLLSDLIS